jgi:hypothetical protein
MFSSGTQFKTTTRALRSMLFALGYNFIQVYQRLNSYKLGKNLFVFTVSPLSTATTVGSQYTTPDGQTFTVQTTAPVGATSLLCMNQQGSPDAAPNTLTYVANSSGTLGTHQATISYSAVSNSNPPLGPFNQTFIVPTDAPVDGL